MADTGGGLEVISSLASFAGVTNLRLCQLFQKEIRSRVLQPETGRPRPR